MVTSHALSYGRTNTRRRTSHFLTPFSRLMNRKYHKQAEVPQVPLKGYFDLKNIEFIELARGLFSGNVSIIETRRPVLSDRPCAQLNEKGNCTGASHEIEKPMDLQISISFSQHRFEIRLS